MRCERWIWHCSSTLEGMEEWQRQPQEQAVVVSSSHTGRHEAVPPGWVVETTQACHQVLLEL